MNIEDRLRFCAHVQEAGYMRKDDTDHFLLENILFIDESTIELFPSPNNQNVRIRTSDPSTIEAIQLPKLIENNGRGWNDSTWSDSIACGSTKFKG
jgi:hypothetical protein